MEGMEERRRGCCGSVFAEHLLSWSGKPLVCGSFHSNLIWPLVQKIKSIFMNTFPKAFSSDCISNVHWVKALSYGAIWLCLPCECFKVVVLAFRKVTSTKPPWAASNTQRLNQWQDSDASAGQALRSHVLITAPLHQSNVGICDCISFLFLNNADQLTY